MPGVVPGCHSQLYAHSVLAMQSVAVFILQYLLRSRIPNDAVFGLRFHQASPLLRLLTTLFRSIIFASIA